MNKYMMDVLRKYMSNPEDVMASVMNNKIDTNAVTEERFCVAFSHGDKAENRFSRLLPNLAQSSIKDLMQSLNVESLVPIPIFSAPLYANNIIFRFINNSNPIDGSLRFVAGIGLVQSGAIQIGKSYLNTIMSPFISSLIVGLVDLPIHSSWINERLTSFCDENKLIGVVSHENATKIEDQLFYPIEVRRQINNFSVR